MAAFMPGGVFDGSTVEAALHAKSTQLVSATATQIGHECCITLPYLYIHIARIGSMRHTALFDIMTAVIHNQT